MDPASRNRVLMIGGALIAIALLLVCGPLQGRFGQSDIDEMADKPPKEAPPVAAGPPAVVEADLTGARIGKVAAEGALAGAAVGETTAMGAAALAAKDAGASGSSSATIEPAAVVAVPPVIAPVVATAASKAPRAPLQTPRPRAAKLPAVSAPPPVAIASLPLALTAVQRAAQAKEAFDTYRPDGMVGNVVDRFAPPVASGPRVSALALAASQGFATRGGSVIRTCDSPGSGCRNSASSLQSGNSPIGSMNPRARGPRQAAP